MTVFNEEAKSLNVLDKPETFRILVAEFAPILLDDPELVIEFDRSRLDPAQAVVHEARFPVPFGKGLECAVHVIEWADGSHRRVYYGQDGTHFLFDEPGSPLEGRVAFSAYVTWDGLGDDELGVLGLGDMAKPPVSDLWAASRASIQEYFTTRRRLMRREQVREWKTDGTYPYQGESKDDAETAERVVFDVVSGTLAGQISTSKQQRRLTLRLLKDSLRHDPGRLTTILHEVVSLNDDDRESLTRLLGETSLPALIRSANVVSERRKFLVALEHMVFDPEDSKVVRERDHLHRILENELWVFGEQYNLMNSERSLRNVARTVLELRGLTDDPGPVLRWDEKDGRVDLHLVAQDRQHGRNRHLVVELKAPSVKAGRKELDQVEDYANAVLDHPAFQSDTEEWEFVLVVTDMHDIAERRIEVGRTDGRFLAPDRRGSQPLVRAYVRTWKSLLNANRDRLDFLNRTLCLDPSVAEAMGYVKAHYGDYLPETLPSSEPDRLAHSPALTPKEAM